MPQLESLKVDFIRSSFRISTDYSQTIASASCFNPCQAADKQQALACKPRDFCMSICKKE